MSLLKPAENTTAFAKVGIQGFAKSGKTFTATNIALGLAREMGDGKPVGFFDTETGSDWVIPRFKEAGIPLLASKSRAFADLLAVVEEAEKECAVLIIDSISHVWKEMVESYQVKLKRKYGLQFQDWGPIKAEWARFTDLYLNSKLHIVMCGRAGYEYDYHIDEETGKRELEKTGTKMKAETEMAYEPSLLLEMERRRATDRAGFLHVCTVLGDRSDQMDGVELVNPTFADFAPHFGCLNIGGEHLGIDTSRNSEGLFTAPDSGWMRKKRIEIALEQVTEAFVLGDINGTSKDDKKKKVEALVDAFGTSSWTAIQGMSLEQIELGRDKIRSYLGIQAPGDGLPLDMDEIEAMTETLNASVAAGTITKEAAQKIRDRAVERGVDVRDELAALTEKAA